MPGGSRRLSIDFMKPSANRVGIRSTASLPVAEDTLAILARMSGLTNSTPLSFPPQASGAYIPVKPCADEKTIMDNTLSQRDQLRARKIHFQQIGMGTGRSGMKDRNDIIPLGTEDLKIDLPQWQRHAKAW
jgi:hypothetical protein